MSYYDKWTIAEVNKADIRDFIPNCSYRASQYVECPFCGASKMKVSHTSKYNLAKCFACDRAIAGPIKAVEVYQGLKFPSSLEYVAKKAGIVINTISEKKQSEVSKQKSKNKGSFCEAQLKASGIDESDVVAKVFDMKGVGINVVPFRKGSVDDKFNPREIGDEMLIYYYGLEGEPRTYKPVSSNVLRQYVRVRWSNPATKLNSEGGEIKYQSPFGAQSIAYIPQKIREKYQKGEHIETLFIQEGEKKAEKACKHGIMSIGIQGINNFGNRKEGLLPEIQYLAKKCSVKNIVFLMDADWDNLSKHLVAGDNVEKRPNLFSKTVIKFKDHCSSLFKQGLNIDIWWGHINENEAGDKGVDDLLCNTLKGKEAELLDDISVAMHSHNGVGTYLDIHKISVLSDTRIEDFWALNNDQDFFDRHRDELTELGVFKFRRVLYKVEAGSLIKVSSRTTDADIYKIIPPKKEGEKDKIEFNMMECLEMLSESGYHRLRSIRNGVDEFKLIHKENGIISWAVSANIRDFIFDYIKMSCKRQDVREYFSTKLDIILGDKKIERLSIVEDDFKVFERKYQKRPYKNGSIEITAEGIRSGLPHHNVWRHDIIDRPFRRVKIIDSMDCINGKWEIVPTVDGQKCEFLKFLCNTSNMAFGYGEEREVSDQEDREFRCHLANKITSIGYLLADWKNPAEKKVVISQDYQMSAVGQAEGGSGKSLVGVAISKIINQTVIDGKGIDDGQFFFESINENSRNVFIDDVKTNFDFSRVFVMVTGKMIIPKKGMPALELPFDLSPKIYIATNNAINKGDEGSTKRRISYMEFSPWYNSEFSPKDEFSHNFFEDWDEYQWLLFDNLMAECVMYYMRSLEHGWSKLNEGIIEPPLANINLRTQRQEMGEVFFEWAESFFDVAGNNVNKELNKKLVMDEFFGYAGTSKHGVTNSNFARKLEAFCKFKHYDFCVDELNKKGVCYKDFKKYRHSEVFLGKVRKSGGKQWISVYTREVI